MTVHELYEQSIRGLPAADRLQLATLILGDIPPKSVVDYRDDWTEEDLEDFSRASFAHIAGNLEPEETSRMNYCE